jgi:hypothetical protein
MSYELSHLGLIFAYNVVLIMKSLVMPVTVTECFIRVYGLGLTS